MEAVAVARSGLTNSVSSTLSAPTAGGLVPTSDTMETVTSALADWSANAGKWRPGLLEISVGGRVSDLLGLGDIVFPAMLTGWALRYDTAVTRGITSASEATRTGGSISLYTASLTGYGLGCVLCEVFQTGQGQPALLYLVPSMLLTMKVVALFRGDGLKMLRFGSDDTPVSLDNNNNEDKPQ